ncbi:class I adenylate-forming enzyme family protein [Phenylobacterium sp.]|uniref:class I adenylate-forming enzyme family protein n=1 Tax=Phenylobacterium sp. TaxID=1871053 RepID=UPI002DE6556B|nr:class I adenylate-forming enzyme family protein [Phenylobacterium sp.]
MALRPTIPGGWRDVASALDRSVASAPDAEALVGRFARYTYAELDVAIDAGAAALAQLGVKAGDRVAACAANHPDIVIAFFAVQRLGAVWVGINRPFAAPEKAFQLKDSGACLLLADAATRAQVEPLRAELPDLRRIVDLEPGETPNEWLRLLADHAGARRAKTEIDPHAPAAIAYTSGTTGFPKGAVHSQHNMVLVAATTHAGLRGAHLTRDLRRGVTLPLTILNLMILEAVAPLSGGGASVCMDRADAVGIAEWVKAERIECFTAAPATVFDLLTRPEIVAGDLASLKFAASGGANVPDELRELHQARFGRPLLGGYGLTEAPTAVAGTTMDRPFVAGSCGRGFAHLKIGILDPDDQEVATGDTGEICVRAADSGPWAGVYTPMLGYWGRPDETAAALRSGWLHTGDLGAFNAAGDLFIRDRLKDLIIRGGANIYPAEVERVLAADPRVRDAAVVGKPDRRLGEVVAVFVELAPGIAADDALEAELRALCAAQLARYKIPELWTFVGQMPRNAMNKVVKARLKELV